MTIVIITNQPRPEWNGLNTKRIDGRNFMQQIINTKGIELNSICYEDCIRIKKEEITSITITY